MKLDVAASRQSAAIPTPASLRRSTETPLRFMASLNRSAEHQLGAIPILIRNKPIR